jgi:hypothetical protein
MTAEENQICYFHLNGRKITQNKTKLSHIKNCNIVPASSRGYIYVDYTILAVFSMLPSKWVSFRVAWEIVFL